MSAWINGIKKVMGIKTEIEGHLRSDGAKGSSQHEGKTKQGMRGVFEKEQQVTSVTVTTCGAQIK